WARQRVELQRVEALLDHRLGAARIVVRSLHLVAPAVRVDADALPATAAEQRVHRLVARLADDVPQRRLDARHRAPPFERAAPLREVVESDLQEMADPEWIASDQVAAELFRLRRDRPVAVVLAVSLPPTDDAGVGGDAHENQVLAPARMNGQDLDGGDLHVGIPGV